MKTFNLRRRLLLGLAVVFAVQGLLVLAMDWYVVQHLVEHQRIHQDQPSVSLAREIFDTLPMVLIPQVIVVALAYGWLWRFLNRVLFLPLLLLSTRFVNTRDGCLQTMHVDDEVPEEVQVLYVAYNRYVKESCRRDDWNEGGQKIPNWERDKNRDFTLD